MTLRLLKKKILASDIEKGILQTKVGIILPDDDMKDRGIRPRWCKVHSIGAEVDLKVGEWILVKSGRWTKGFNFEGTELRMIDYPDAILLASDSDPRLSAVK